MPVKRADSEDLFFQIAILTSPANEAESLFVVSIHGGFAWLCGLQGRRKVVGEEREREGERGLWVPLLLGGPTTNVSSLSLSCSWHCSATVAQQQTQIHKSNDTQRTSLFKSKKKKIIKEKEANLKKRKKKILRRGE